MSSVVNTQDLVLALQPLSIINQQTLSRTVIEGFSLDSRTLKKGECFIALKGPNFDGNDFIAEAVQRGASMVVASRQVPEASVPLVIVYDTRAALGAVAATVRKGKKTAVIGITGSVGKTTTKEMLYRILREKKSVVCSEANENNYIGVSKALFKIASSPDICIAEMGSNKYGEILDTYNAKNGLVNSYCNYKSCAIDASGTLYFGGTHGITKFHPDTITNNYQPPILSLSHVYINNQLLTSIEDHTLDHTSRFEYSMGTLSYKRNNIEFVCNAINFINPQENRYTYRLLGLDSAWTTGSFPHSAKFNTLPSGDYTFQIRASNNNNIWTQETLSVQFTISPPWWETWIFRIGLAGFVLADDLGTQCAAVSESTTGCPDMSSTDCKNLLQQCADYYDQQSAQLAADLTKTSAQKNTLQNAIAALKTKISSLAAQINQSTVMVKDLNLQISDTQVSIDKTTADIQDSQNQIATILRAVNEEDQKPSFVILLEGDLSDFFSNLAYLDNLNSKVSDLLDNTKNLKSYLQGQQVKMSDNVDQLQKTIALQTLQKKQNKQNQQQQNQYLQLTEAQYQQQLKDKQDAEAKSAKIKSMLFQMVGVSKVPTFGEALDVAQAVSKLVSIRPAFLLAIISQESAIGKNVGQCVLTDPNTGAGKKVSSGAATIRVMKPTRDVQPFIQITTALGRDPYNTPVSCWIPAYVGGVPTGWGGAMGPAQFIASTWNLFVDRLRVLLGQTADPWGIKDSFTAAALYLSDLGASAQTSTKESAAASKYYGGSSSYARSVMTRASCIQTFIDNSTMSTDCQNLIF